MFSSSVNVSRDEGRRSVRKDFDDVNDLEAERSKYINGYAVTNKCLVKSTERGFAERTAALNMVVVKQ